jgi:phosphatidylglycerophosphate synthase
MTVDYEPTSRRPIGDIFRKTAQNSVRLCVRLNIAPDTVSYLSIVASALAALCFWQSGTRWWLLLIGPAFCYLRLWFNMLDGMVALASGKASLRGEILNDLPDRLSDILIFVGVAHSGLCSPFPAYWAAILAVLTAYVGMFGQAVGVQREFSGVMSKPWRMVTLHIGAWVMFAFIVFDFDVLFDLSWANRIEHPSVLDWTCIVIIAGCTQTIWIRLKRIMSALEIKAKH